MLCDPERTLRKEILHNHTELFICAKLQPSTVDTHFFKTVAM